MVSIQQPCLVNMWICEYILMSCECNVVYTATLTWPDLGGFEREEIVYPVWLKMCCCYVLPLELLCMPKRRSICCAKIAAFPSWMASWAAALHMQRLNTGFPSRVYILFASWRLQLLSSTGWYAELAALYKHHSKHEQVCPAYLKRLCAVKMCLLCVPLLDDLQLHLYSVNITVVLPVVYLWSLQPRFAPFVLVLTILSANGIATFLAILCRHARLKRLLQSKMPLWYPRPIFLWASSCNCLHHVRVWCIPLLKIPRVQCIYMVLTNAYSWFRLTHTHGSDWRMHMVLTDAYTWFWPTHTHGFDWRIHMVLTDAYT